MVHPQHFAITHSNHSQLSEWSRTFEHSVCLAACRVSVTLDCSQNEQVQTTDASRFVLFQLISCKFRWDHIFYVFLPIMSIQEPSVSDYSFYVLIHEQASLHVAEYSLGSLLSRNHSHSITPLRLHLECECTAGVLFVCSILHQSYNKRFYFNKIWSGCLKQWKDGERSWYSRKNWRFSRLQIALRAMPYQETGTSLWYQHRVLFITEFLCYQIPIWCRKTLVPDSMTRAPETGTNE